METKVINLLGGSGVRKSTLARKLALDLCERGYQVETPFEYPKELVYAERTKDFPRQVYIFAKVLYRLECLIGKVDYVISDSPLLLSLLYHDGRYGKIFDDFILSVFNKFDNYNFFINRIHKFEASNRNEKSAEESDALALNLWNKLTDLNIPFTMINGDVRFVPLILERICA